MEVPLVDMSFNTQDRLNSMEQDQKEFFLDYLNEVGFFDLEELHPLYKQSSPEQIDDIRLKVVMLAGIGKNLSLEGDFIEANIAFDMAIKNAEDNPDVIKGDILAFLYYELLLFCRQSFDITTSKRYAVLAKQHAETNNLQLLIDYQFALFKAEASMSQEIEKLNSYMVEFQKRKMYFMEVMVMIRLGIIYEDGKDWKKAD